MLADPAPQPQNPWIALLRGLRAMPGPPNADTAPKESLLIRSTQEQHVQHHDTAWQKVSRPGVQLRLGFRVGFGLGRQQPCQGDNQIIFCFLQLIGVHSGPIQTPHRGCTGQLSRWEEQQQQKQYQQRQQLAAAAAAAAAAKASASSSWSSREK